jgi:hypothetical protein
VSPTILNRVPVQSLYKAFGNKPALLKDGHLRPGVSVDEARDLLWTYNSPELYELLVLQRGWSPQRVRPLARRRPDRRRSPPLMQVGVGCRATLDLAEVHGWLRSSRSSLSLCRLRRPAPA